MRRKEEEHQFSLETKNWVVILASSDGKTIHLVRGGGCDSQVSPVSERAAPSVKYGTNKIQSIKPKSPALSHLFLSTKARKCIEQLPEGLSWSGCKLCKEMLNAAHNPQKYSEVQQLFSGDGFSQQQKGSPLIPHMDPLSLVNWDHMRREKPPSTQTDQHNGWGLF